MLDSYAFLVCCFYLTVILENTGDGLLKSHRFLFIWINRTDDMHSQQQKNFLFRSGNKHHILISSHDKSYTPCRINPGSPDLTDLYRTIRTICKMGQKI